VVQELLPNEFSGTYTLIPAGRTITTTAPILIDAGASADLSADRTISIDVNAPIYINASKLDLDFNVTNLQITGIELNTIQDIDTTASPQFNQLSLGTPTNARDLTLVDQHDAGSVSFLSGWQGGYGWWLDSQLLSTYSIGLKSILKSPPNGTTIITVTTDSTHTFEVGNEIVMSDCTVSAWDGNYIVYEPITSDTFRIWKSGALPADETSDSGGTIALLVGAGYNYSLELDDLTIRGTLSVWELLVQQIRVTNGNLLVTASARVDSVNLVAEPIVVTVEDVTEHGFAPFAVGDLVMIQVVNLSGIDTEGGDYTLDGDDYTLDDGWFLVKRLIYKVTAVSGLDVTLDEDRSGALLNAPPNKGVPEKGDGLVRFGSATDTDRQGMIGLYSDEYKAPYIRITDDVSSWATWKDKESFKGQFGNIEGISDDWFGGLLSVLGVHYGVYTQSFVSSGDSFFAGTIYASAGGFGTKGTQHSDGYYIEIDGTWGLVINKPTTGWLTTYIPTQKGISEWYDFSGTWAEVFSVGAGDFRVGSVSGDRVEWSSAGASLIVQGVLRSASATSLYVGNGFYIHSVDGTARFGTVGGGVLTRGIAWDDTDFYIQGGGNNRNIVKSPASTYWDYEFDDYVTATIVTDYTSGLTNPSFETGTPPTIDPSGWDATNADYGGTRTMEFHTGCGTSTTYAKEGTQSYWFRTIVTGAMPWGVTSYIPGVKYADIGHTNLIKEYYQTIESTGTVFEQLAMNFSTASATVYLRISFGNNTGFLPDGAAGDVYGIYFDDLEVFESEPFYELSDTGVFLFNTPYSYLKASVEGIELKGLDIDADDIIVRGNLIVYGNTALEGGIASIPPGYNNANWDTAYGWGDHSVAGYITGNESITLSGHVTGSGATAITTTLVVAAITGQTELASGLASADELLVSDSGIIKRMDISVIQTYMQNNLNFTPSLTTEEVQDIVGLMVQGGSAQTLIAVTYDDTNGELDFAVDSDLSGYSNASSNFFDTAGTGLTSSGSTVNVIGGDGITANSNDVALDINSLDVAVIADGDFIPFWDITVTATNKKITFANFEGTIDHEQIAGKIANEHIDHSGVSVIAGAGMTGGGTIESDRTLNVIGTADKITVSADAITIASTYAGQTSIITVGTLTTGAINWSGGITTSGDISGDDVNAVTLFTHNGTTIVNASKEIENITKLTVDNIIIDLNTISTSTGNLNLDPAGDVVFNPTGNDILPANNYDLNIGSATKKYLTLHAVELWVDTLVAHETISTTGGRLLVAYATELTADLSAVATTMTVKHNNLRDGDICYLEKAGQIEFIEIDSTYGGSEGVWTYTIIRDKDGTGANIWIVGDAMLNTGQSSTGDGFIELYSMYSFAQSILESIYNSDSYSSSFSSNYADSNDWELWDEDVTPDSNDCVYLGTGYKFYKVVFDIQTAGDFTYELKYEYWNGGSWEDVVLDTTPDFEVVGKQNLEFHLTIENWAKTTVNSESKFWIRIRINSLGTFTTNPIQGYQPVFVGGLQHGPTIVGHKRNSSGFNDFSPRWAIGNLDGLYGYGSNEVGVGFGEYNSTTGNWVTITDTDGIKLFAKGTANYIQLDTTNGITFYQNSVNTLSLALDGSGFLASGYISWDDSQQIKIGNWQIFENVIKDTNNYVVIKSGTDAGYVKASGRILIDGSITGGTVFVGTGVEIIGVGAGSITVGDITIAGDSNGSVTLGSSGKLISSTDAAHIEIYQNDLLFYDGNSETLTFTYGDTTYSGAIMSMSASYTYNFGQEFRFQHFGFESARRFDTSPLVHADRELVYRYGRIIGDDDGAIANTALMIYHQQATSHGSNLGYYFNIDYTGKLNWNDPGAAATWDTNLYRGGANLLKTDDVFESPTIRAGDGSAGAWTTTTAHMHIYRDSTYYTLINHAQGATNGGLMFRTYGVSTASHRLVSFRDSADTERLGLNFDGGLVNDNILYPEISLVENTTNKKWTVTVDASKLNNAVGNYKRALMTIWFSEWSTYYNTVRPFRHENTAATFKLLEGWLLIPSEAEGGAAFQPGSAYPYEFVTNEAGQLKFEMETDDTSIAKSTYINVEIQGIIYRGATALSFYLA